MTSPAPPPADQARPPGTGSALAQRLWQRAGQPGCVRHRRAQAIAARHWRLAGGPPLAERLLRRARAAADDGPGRPVVAARPAGARLAPPPAARPSAPPRPSVLGGPAPPPAPLSPAARPPALLPPRDPGRRASRDGAGGTGPGSPARPAGAQLSPAAARAAVGPSAPAPPRGRARGRRIRGEGPAGRTGPPGRIGCPGRAGPGGRPRPGDGPGPAGTRLSPARRPGRPVVKVDGGGRESGPGEAARRAVPRPAAGATVPVVRETAPGAWPPRLARAGPAAGTTAARRPAGTAGSAPGAPAAARTTPARPAGSRADAPGRERQPARPAPPPIDVERIVSTVQRKIVRQLVIEQERRGMRR